MANSSHGYTNLVHDKKNGRLFTSNEVGVISIYSISNVFFFYKNNFTKIVDSDTFEFASNF